MDEQIPATIQCKERDIRHVFRQCSALEVFFINELKQQCPDHILFYDMLKTLIKAPEKGSVMEKRITHYLPKNDHKPDDASTEDIILCPIGYIGDGSQDPFHTLNAYDPRTYNWHISTCSDGRWYISFRKNIGPKMTISQRELDEYLTVSQRQVDEYQDHEKQLMLSLTCVELDTSHSQGEKLLILKPTT